MQILCHSQGEKPITGDPGGESPTPARLTPSHLPLAAYYGVKMGNSFLSWSLSGRSPYSQISNASAYCTFLAALSP